MNSAEAAEFVRELVDAQEKAKANYLMIPIEVARALLPAQTDEPRPPGELIGRFLDALWDRGAGITLAEARRRYDATTPEVISVELKMAWGEHWVFVDVRQGSDPESLAEGAYNAIRKSMRLVREKIEQQQDEP